jgi:hypothetical protein
MQNRVLRTILALLALAALAGAGYKLFLMERQAGAARESAVAFETEADALTSTILELRAAQQAYVAQGQGESFWTARATTLTDAVKQAFEKLRPLATTADASRALSDTAGALASFERIDASARSYINNQQHLLASDLIFTDGFEATKTLAAAVDDARVQERYSRDRSLQQLRRSEIYIVAAAVGVCLGVLLVLAPAPGRRRDETSLVVSGGTSEARETTRDLTRREAYRTLIARDTPLAGKPADSSSRARTADSTDAIGGIERAEAVAAAPTVPREATSAPFTTTIADAARLCADLARVAEAQELPGLLQRAAELLDASGIIVWVQDATGLELRPAISHGYASQVMSRLRAIPRDADNATAAAYRAGELRVVEGDAATPGAVVVPLLTSLGPAGVMAAEIRRGGETSTATQAIATIVAAQISTLVPVRVAGSK